MKKYDIEYCNCGCGDIWMRFPRKPFSLLGVRLAVERVWKKIEVDPEGVRTFEIL